MATFQVLINGVDRTSVITYDTFTAELGAKGEITTCSFDIRDESKSLEIRGAQSIQVLQDGTAIWYGFVGNVQHTFTGGINLIAVDGQSANVMLDQKAYRKISKSSTGAAGSATDKGSIRKGSRTIGAEVLWLLSSSACSPGASPIIYDGTKIYAYTSSYSDTRDYGDFDAPTLRDALAKFCKDAYGSRKMTYWVDANGKLNIQPTGHSVNMVDNFDFDVLPAGTDWTLAGGATVVIAAGQSTPGTATVDDYGVSLTASGQSASQVKNVTAGKRYYISAGVKNVTNNRAQLRLVWKTSGGTTISTDSLTTTTTGSWTRVEGVYTAPATAATCTYTLGYTGTTGTVYWDNCNMYLEDAAFGISDTPNNTSTFAPEEYEESSDTSSLINAIAIKGSEYTYGGSSLEDKKTANKMYYLEYPASIAYFGRVFTSAITDTAVSTATKARNAARKIFAESAFPIRSGTYKISSTKLGSLIPVPGTYQIFQMSRMPSAKQVTVNRIETVTVLPYGAGEVVYEIQFGASKGNIASALATLGSAMWGTGLPAVHSTTAEHSMPTESAINVTRTLTDPQTTGAAAEVEQGASIRGLAKIPVIKKNTGLVATANLPSLADYGDTEFPIGSLVLLVPNAGDPHLTKPTLYRSDGVSTWTAVTPAQLKSDALGSGAMGQGMIVADSIFAGTIDAGSIDVTNLNASNITTGTLTSIAINAGSGKFTVDSSGNALANSITLGSTATVNNTAGNEVTGSIYSRPGDNVTSAQFRLVADNSNNLTKSITGITSSGAAANANCTINATAHPFSAGQFVWFTGATGAGAAALNAITESLPAQIISTTTNAFVINYYLAIGAITAGTATAGKRLSVVAPSGLFVYQSDTKPGALATGSIALGSSLTKLGKGSTATLADGEIGFLTSATPRYAGGGNLYSPDGTATVATSGDFQLGASSSSAAGAVVFKNGTGGSVRPFSATAGNTSLAIKNSDGSAYSPLVASGFYPGGQGTANLNHDGTQFTLNDTVSITGNLTTSGTLNGSNLPTYVRTAISTASTTSIAAGGFQDHTVTFTSTSSTPTVIIASVYHSGSTSADLNATVWSRTATSATIRIYNSGAAASTSSRQAMVMVGLG
jgi:hypothetical protein